MSKVVLDVAMSLDGFTAGPDIGAANPMGKGGERLHAWMWTAGNEPDGEVDIGFSPVNATVGRAVIGRRTFDLGVGPWGGTPWPGVPSFVVPSARPNWSHYLSLDRRSRPRSGGRPAALGTVSGQDRVHFHQAVSLSFARSR
jgi:dihydrofolate reductase